MAYLDHGDGDHHDEQIVGDGDPQRHNGLYQVLSVLMPFLLCSTFTCDNVLSTFDSEIERSLGNV